MEEQQPQTENRLYWIVVNTRKAIVNVIRRAFSAKPVLSWAILLIVLFLAFASRSSLQPFFIGVRKYMLLIIVVALLLYLYFKRWTKRSNRGNIYWSIALILVTFFAIYAGPGIYRYLSLYTHYAQLDKTKLTHLPETGNERIQPINSIKTLVNQEALSATEDATNPRFIRGTDGKYYFSAAVGPSKDYKIQQLRKNMYEVLNIPAHLPSPIFSEDYRTKVDFNVGELMLFSKQTRHAVVRGLSIGKFFNCEAAEPIYLQNESGQWVQVVPLIRWKGILFPRPVFGGVVVLQQEDGAQYAKRVLLGSGTYIAPTEIKHHAYLTGQNLIPEEVAIFIAESFRFVHGFWAPMPFYHEGDIRIPMLKEDVNQQPFITYFDVDQQGKLYNFFGLEPYQENKKGLSLSLLIPGDDDQHVYFVDHRTSNDSYIGSSAISAKVVESKKNYDWTKNYPAESRPYVRKIDDEYRFLWLSTIVTKAGDQGEYIGGSIPEITLTDAKHGKVVWVHPDSLVRQDSWIKQAESELKDYWQGE